jgi:hypothetical protein
VDFSLYEQRQLAEMERELATDRRLTAITVALGSGGPRIRRRLRCLVARLRYRRPAVGSRWAIVAMVAALVVTVAVPVLLITALVVKLSLLAVVAVGVLPVAPVLLVLAQDRATRPRS